MPKRYPHISIALGYDASGERTTCELNALGIGFGIFQTWLFMAIFNVSKVFEQNLHIGYVAYIPADLANTVLNSFLSVSAILLIFIGITNQRFLEFYVNKVTIWISAGLCCLGTLLIFGACVTGDIAPMTEFGSESPAQIGILQSICSILSGTLMGAGSSILIVLWGTGFARYKFPTIVLNAAFAIAFGVVLAFILMIWVPSPYSGFTTAFLPLIAVFFLWVLTPMPYYERKETPIFHPLPANEAKYVFRMGIPTAILGIAVGALRIICVSEILSSHMIVIQLIFGAACGASLIVFIAAIALCRNDPYWDTLFRSITPVIVICVVFIPFLVGALEIAASFFVSLGYLCLEVLLWVFFADISNRFKLSPIFVFGLGRGIMEIASLIGSWITMSMYNPTASQLDPGLVVLALICAVAMSLGYSTLPRERELRKEILLGRATLDERVNEDADTMNADLAQADRGDKSLLKPSGKSSDIHSGKAPENDTTEGTEANTEQIAEDNAKQSKGRFKIRCEEIATTYMLSKREKEVMLLLAKGHNAAFIQDKLCVSKSTAKTHINHIYKKLDIHTQQELLTMVEERRGHDDHSEDMRYSIGTGMYTDREALQQAANEVLSDTSKSRPKIMRNFNNPIFK